MARVTATVGKQQKAEGRQLTVEDLHPDLLARKAPQDVHVSDIKLFAKCRLAWSWGSPLRLSLRKKQPTSALWVGTAIHAALDEYYGGNHTPPHVYLQKVWFPKELARLRRALGSKYQEMREGFQEDIDLAYSIAETFWYWARKHDDFTVLATEMPFEVPVTPEFTFVGTMDAIVKVGNRLWIHDYKTTVQWWDDDYVLRDDQSIGYVAAARYLYPDVAGIIYTFILKKAPTQPRILKSGRLSFAGINTTLECAVDAIQANDQSVDDYVLELTELAEHINDDMFVRRVRVHHSQETLDMWWRNLRTIGTAMVSPATSVYPSPSMFNCRMCSFQEPCSLYIAGFDPTQHLLANYTAAARAEDVAAE